MRWAGNDKGKKFIAEIGVLMNAFETENQNIEYKLAKRELPKSFWETVLTIIIGNFRKAKIVRNCSLLIANH